MISIQYSVFSVQRRVSRAVLFALGLFRHGRTSLWLGVLLVSLGICESALADELILEDKIVQLEEEFRQRGAQGTSAAAGRRILKNVARKGLELVRESSEAPNRFRVLGLVFDCQKRLLALDNTEENRAAIFETCRKLKNAPDEYAAVRLEADLLLSERELTAANATVAARVKVLDEIIDKYRNTSAERRCLRIALMIASKLRASDLETEIRKRLAGGRFGGDHEIIASKPLADLNTVFSGTYESADNVPVKFPSDRLGHSYLVLFWSSGPKGSEGHETFLARIKEQQEQFAGRFEVYSFNLDEMPDAGKGILSKSGVKGTALRLPGGRRNSAYQAYARRDPVAILVNAQGHSALNAPQIPNLGMWLDGERYVAQLRSLFVGDFLVMPSASQRDEHPTSNIQHPTPKIGDSLPSVTIEAMQSCFTLPPFRYRLAPKPELDGYRKAEKLCSAAIKKHSQAPDLWRVRNRRIIALIGMCNLAREPKYMAQAVEEAKAMLATELPPGADVVARFCLAKDALWGEGARPEALLRDFIDTEGGGKAPARSLAAAAVLAIEANAGPLYQECRQRLLSLSDRDHPDLWPVLSLMRDRHHNHRLFWGNPGRWGYGNVQKYRCRYVVSGLSAPQTASRVLVATLKGLDGGELKIPDVTKEKMTGVIFVEPPVDVSDRAVCVKRLNDFAGQFSRPGVPVIVAFLSEDTGAVKSMIKECGGSFRPAMVPGGLGNPLVRRLGILSADRIPNPFLLHGDGAIAWWISGLTYTVARTPMEHAVSSSIGINIEKVRTDRAFQPLEQGDFRRAVLLLTERLPPKKGADWWTADRFQGRALAHMGLKDWEASLTDVDAAMSARAAASRLKRQLSMGDAEMHLAKSTILKKLGRDEDARKERTIAEQGLVWLANNPDGGYGEKPPSYARGGVPVGVYDDLLKRVRLALPGEVK